MSWDEEGRLDSKTHAEIFEKSILPETNLRYTTPQEHPKAVVLAGQPGAGKGGLADAVEREFSGNIVKIDPDEMRDPYPGVERLREQYPYTWSDKTHHDASQWGKDLRQRAVHGWSDSETGEIFKGNRNVLIDTTLGNADSAVQTIKELQAKGYEVEVRAVATHRLESEVGVDQRFTKSLDQKGYGRYVPEGARTHIYEALPGNLDKVQAETGAHIRIYNRDGQQLYDNHTSPMKPSAALEQAREARMTDPEITKKTSRGWQQQQHWHEDLPENLERNPKVSPDAAQKILQERSGLKVVEGVSQSSAEAATLDRTVRIEPGAARVRTGLKVAGGVAMAYDVASTGMDVKHALDADNTTAAQSSIMHFGGRNLGMLGGATLFAGAAAAAGVETGPGAFVAGLAGGVVGAVAGDKIMDAVDKRRIYTQNDPQGNSWSYDSHQGWTREKETGEVDLSAPEPVFKTETLHADPELTNRLNYQASSTAVELALPHAPTPQNPYVQPSPDNQNASPWMRDPQTHTWSRTVMDNPEIYATLAAGGDSSQS